MSTPASMVVVTLRRSMVSTGGISLARTSLDSRCLLMACGHRSGRELFAMEPKGAST